MESFEFKTGVILHIDGKTKVYALTEEEMFYAQAFVDAIRRHENTKACTSESIPHKATSLAALRISKGYTQLELAKRIGVARTSVAMWEIGKATPTHPNLVALAKLFDVSVDDICALIERR